MLRVYIETTIPSYLAARPSRDVADAGRQQITRDWWERARHEYSLCVSPLVLMEAAAGDSEAAQARLGYVQGLEVLEVSEEAIEAARRILSSGLLPMTAERDALHIATAAFHGVDIVLTWNCRHIANAAIVKQLRALTERLGYELPILCTPDELLGEHSNDVQD